MDDIRTILAIPRNPDDLLWLRAGLKRWFAGYARPLQIVAGSGWWARFESGAARIAAVVTRDPDAALIDTCRVNTTPVVVIAANGPRDIPRAWFDDEVVGRQAATFLLARGFRSLAYQENRDDDHVQRPCYRAFQKAATASGATVHRWSPAPWPDRPTRHWALQHWLQHLPRPTAFYCHDDEHATWVRDELAGLGLIIGRDHAMLGTGDRPIAASTGLSSVRLPWLQLAHEAGRMVQVLLSGSPAEDTGIRPLGVLARASTELIPADPLVTRLLADLRADPLLAWSAQRLANRHGMSRNTFTRQLKRRTGSLPRDWLLAIRVDLAREALLNEPDTPITAIAKRLGWSDAGHLAGAFRRLHHMTPSDMRAATARTRLLQ